MQRLRELGWVEGHTLAIEYRWAEGREERYAEIAAEFVRLNVDVIVAFGTTAASAKQATSTIPIVFPVADDPVGSHLVASLARPGGNLTGLSAESPDLAGKRLGVLREVVRGLVRLAVLVNASYPASALERGEVQKAANMLGIEGVTLQIRRAEDIEPAFAALNGRAEALYVAPDSLTSTNLTRIITLAQRAHLPTMFGFREAVEAGGLMSYGPKLPAQFRRAAEYVDKILRGAKPADLPIEQPTRFELVVNVTTAKSLGLTIPESFLALADEVIE